MGMRGVSAGPRPGQLSAFAPIADGEAEVGIAVSKGVSQTSSEAAY